MKAQLICHYIRLHPTSQWAFKPCAVTPVHGWITRNPARKKAKGSFWRTFLQILKKKSQERHKRTKRCSATSKRLKMITHVSLCFLCLWFTKHQQTRCWTAACIPERCIQYIQWQMSSAVQQCGAKFRHKMFPSFSVFCNSYFVIAR